MLNHVLLCGSRFDHNRTIWRQLLDDLGVFHRDPGAPAGVWSFGAWKDNTMEQLQTGLAVPEEVLLPYYRKALGDGKDALTRLLQRARALIEPIPPGATEEEAAVLLADEIALVERYRRECFGLDALRIARGGECEYGYGPPRPGFMVESVPHEAIVASQLDVFLQERGRLDEVIDIARRL